MHISRETTDPHSIQSYSDTQILVNQTSYQRSVLISKAAIMEWDIHGLKELDLEHLAPIVALQPEILLLGHNQLSVYPPMAASTYLSKHRIGLESMSIGAAARTFNVLLGEGRKVVLGIIF